MSSDLKNELHNRTLADEQRHPIPGSLNLSIAALQVMSALAIFYFTSLANAWWHILGLACLFGLLGNSIYSIIHEAEHGILHPVRWINDAVGVCMALLFPAPFHLIRQGHIGHHRLGESDVQPVPVTACGIRRISRRSLQTAEKKTLSVSYLGDHNRRGSMADAPAPFDGPGRWLSA